MPQVTISSSLCSIGAKHDGSGPAGELPSGHPGATKCNKKGGYVMNSPRVNTGPAVFSNCSQEQFRFMLKIKGRECWRTETSHDFFTVNKNMAERDITAETYCGRRFGSLFISGKYDNCEITCTNKAGKGTPRGKWTQRFPAPFGFPCSNYDTDKVRLAFVPFTFATELS